ncbi:MAG: hypothetical protein Q4G25_11465, partial [Paracoccus sp. (in: a-proteobacteria)]|nr:hypothetical protein [Paracoccus sp. (in: a-proteobacteria)]
MRGLGLLPGARLLLWLLAHLPGLLGAAGLFWLARRAVRPRQRAFRRGQPQAGLGQKVRKIADRRQLRERQRRKIRGWLRLWISLWFRLRLWFRLW